MQEYGENSIRLLLGWKPLSLSLLLAVSPQQLAIDFGDLLQVVFHRMVILNPGANPLDMLGAERNRRCVIDTVTE